MVNFKDKSMPAVIDKALDFINGMNTSASVPHPMDESTAKGIFKYLNELGVPARAADVAARGDREGWNAGFTEKLVGWAEKLRQENGCLLKTLNIFLYICESSFGRWYKPSARKKIYLPRCSRLQYGSIYSGLPEKQKDLRFLASP